MDFPYLCQRFEDQQTYKMNRLSTILQIIFLLVALLPAPVKGQVNAADSVMSHASGNRLSIGGYGEVAYSRNFYSDNVYRYSSPKKYKDDPSNGRFDIPHAVIYLGYDFGKGWTLGTEIEFEHTGTGSAVELEADEGGEYETEVEKGGEVELEQFWIQKTFGKWANIRMGHIVVPVGLNNAHHEPLNFFTVYRPEGEHTILPSTWHDTGISFWGRYKDFRYELQMVAGLNALLFSRDGWIHNGSGSPYEFKPANKYGFALRLDNYTLNGLRLGLSGYIGQAMHNTSPNNMEGKNKTFGGTKALVCIGSFDFTYNRYNWLVRGQADYGYISGTPMLNSAKLNMPKTSPYNKTYVGKNAVAIGIEASYDIFSQIPRLRNDNQKLYIFGRYDYYDSYREERSQPSYGYTKRKCVAVGVNYHPIPQVAIKAHYSQRFLDKAFNNEPSINLGVAYEGFFL